MGAAALGLSLAGGCAAPDRATGGPTSPAWTPRPVDHAALVQAVRNGDRNAYVTAAGSPGGAVYDAITACRPSGYRVVASGDGFSERLSLRLGPRRTVTFTSPLTAFGAGDAFWRTWGSALSRTDGSLANVVTAHDRGSRWAGALDRAARAAGRVLGVTPRGFAALVAPTGAVFGSLTGFDSDKGIVAACVTTLTRAAVPVIVVSPDLRADGEVSRSVLAHELAHLLLAPDGRADRSPPWLAEGLAEYVAVAVTDSRAAARRASLGAVGGGEHDGLPSAASFGSTDAQLREAAYLRAYLAAAALVEAWGMPAVVERYRAAARTGVVAPRAHHLAERSLRRSSG